MHTIRLKPCDKIINARDHRNVSECKGHIFNLSCFFLLFVNTQKCVLAKTVITEEKSLAYAVHRACNFIKLNETLGAEN